MNALYALTNETQFLETLRQWKFDYGLFTNLPRVIVVCDFSPSSFELKRLLVSTGLLVISTFVISKFNSVWPNNNFFSLAHKDWLLLSISYHVFLIYRGIFTETLEVASKPPGMLSIVFLYNKLILGLLLRVCQKTLFLKTFVFFPRFFLYQKHWNLEKKKKEKEKLRIWPIRKIRSLWNSKIPWVGGTRNIIFGKTQFP